MGNGARFDYTQEERATLLAQFAKAMEFANEGKRPFQEVSRPLQVIISTDLVLSVGPRIADTSEDRIFHIVGNYTSAAAAIEAGDYQRKWGLAETPEEIPMIIQPVDCRVRAVPLGRRVKAKEMFGLYPRIVDPMTLFTFGAKFSEELNESPRITVWLDAKGRFWVAGLDVYVGQRNVHVSQFAPEYEFGGHCIVLVRE